MSEPTIICPKCKNEIKLTESLAAPLIESTKRDYEARLVQKVRTITRYSLLPTTNMLFVSPAIKIRFFCVGKRILRSLMHMDNRMAQDAFIGIVS